MTLLDAPSSETEEDRKQRKQDDDDLMLLLLLELEDDGPQRAWRRFVPGEFGGLIDLDGFTWNDQDQEYVSNSGTTINGATVQRLIAGASRSAELEIERSLQTTISEGTDEALDEWHDETMTTLTDLYAASAAAGAGGIDGLDEDDLNTIVGEKDRGLTGAAESIADITDKLKEDSPDLSPAQAVNRAGMNGGVAHTVFQEVRRDSHRDVKDEDGNATFTMEKNVLTDGADHCSECPELSELEWQPIGTMPVPGLRECRQNDLCHMIYATDFESDNEDGDDL